MRVAWVVSMAAVALLCGLPGSATAAVPSEVADAVMRGDKAALRQLLAKKVDVNAPQADGATALHWAAHRDDLEAADLLLRAGARVQVANRQGFTPLFVACINGNPVLVTRLLEAGADAKERLRNGETALMMAARNGNLVTIKALLDRGAEVNAKENLRGTTALMWAAAQRNSSAVKLLIEGGADVGAKSNPAPADRPAYLTPKYKPEDFVKADAPDSFANNAGAAAAAAAPPRPRREVPMTGGGLTPLIYAARENDLDSVRILLAAGADVNQVSNYGWTALLTATQNRYYQLGAVLLERGADPNIANNGGWTPLYRAVDNRNVPNGDYPVRKRDMDHLEFIKLLLDKGANVNVRVKDSTWTRTTFTQQWLYEAGATPFLRAAQSSDVVLMRLLMERGADPKIPTEDGVTPLAVSAGVGYTEGITYQWSVAANEEAVKLLLDVGIDPNAQSDMGHTALHGAAHKGLSTKVVQMLVDHGGKLDIYDYGHGLTAYNFRSDKLLGIKFLPVDYADGLVKVGTQQALAHPEVGLYIRDLMTKAGLKAPPMGRTVESICLVGDCTVSR